MGVPFFLTPHRSIGKTTTNKKHKEVPLFFPHPMCRIIPVHKQPSEAPACFAVFLPFQTGGKVEEEWWWWA